MSDHLVTYLRDHHAGATFAIELLEDLTEQKSDARVATLAAQLLAEIQDDKETLKDLAEEFQTETRGLKDIASWISQKASLFKLDVNTPLGLFEAVEFLCLGILGKLALWNALEQSGHSFGRFDLPHLARRAKDQHARLESLRLALAAEIFRPAL